MLRRDSRFHILKESAPQAASHYLLYKPSGRLQLKTQSAPDWIRTSDRPLRRRMLYPTELQALLGGLLAVVMDDVKIRVRCRKHLVFGFQSWAWRISLGHAHGGLRRII